MQTKSYLLWASLLSAFLLANCGGSKEAEQKEAEKKEAETSVSPLGAMSAMKELADQAESMQKNGPVKTVDFRALKELLPADADGLTRQEATGEKNGAAGFTFSTATGKYANADNSETIELTIVDGGGSGLLMGLAAWSMMEMDKETASGYEKTGTLSNYKSYEKYDNNDKSGEIAVLVEKRFVVTAKGNGITMDKLKATLDDVDLKKLGALK